MTDESKEHTISFSVQNGNFVYNGEEDISSYIKTKHKDTIKWINDEDRPFSINFGWDFPFEKQHYQAKKPKQGEKKEISIDVPKESPHGDYKYTIAVYDDDGMVWIDDPRIIITPPID